MFKKSKSVIALILVAALVACAGPGAGEPAATPAAPPAAAPAAPAAPEPTSWAEEHLFVDRTVDELYALALEEGNLTIFTISSRTQGVADSFMEQYPGINVEVFDLRQNELIERFEREYAAGIRNVDLLHTQDLDGTMWFEFVARNMLHIYRPADMVEFIDPVHMRYGMPLFIEMQQWFYNTEAFPDGAPISSWWDVTRPEWSGMVMIRDPLADIATLSNLTALVQFADEMAADYERVFGQPITLSPGTPTASHEWLRRFMANDPIFTTSSGEIITAIGTPGQTNPPIGFAMSSGLRRTIERGYVLNFVNITPASGVPHTSFLYITDEAPNPNAARLMVRWLMGEADGQGVGFDPWNTLGGWPVRSDQELEPGSTPLSEINIWNHDVEFIYENIHDVADFWLTLLQ